MTLVVPFDGSELAEAALVRATEFGIVFEEDVLAVSVVPMDDTKYAREHGWIGPNEEFDQYAPSGAISKRLRKVAKREDASMVFIGSENAGHLVTSVSSVGDSVAADESYDVVIVRDRSPAKIAKLNDASPHREEKSDFYLPQ